jgi:hypothetical protein
MTTTKETQPDINPARSQEFVKLAFEQLSRAGLQRTANLIQRFKRGVLRACL